jgi:cyclohexyl-isocyanide hydratase
LDQADFTGPIEVLSRVPNSVFHIIAQSLEPVRDVRGLGLLPTITFTEAPPLDLLVIPGGAGVNVAMQDEDLLAFVRRQSANAHLTFSVCTGAFILGAAGLLRNRKATTHWASHHLLSYFGAHPQKERVVFDEPIVTAAGVTSGVDGALQIVAHLRGTEAAQRIQLYMEYAPEPPFDSGDPATAPPQGGAGASRRIKLDRCGAPRAGRAV